MLELAQHRRALVRSHALPALGAIERRGARAAQSQMLSALEDESTEVSTAAAKALVLIGTRSALPALFAAYDRGLAAALATIGELAGRESVETLLERAPAGKIETVEPALNRLLERKALSAVDQVKLAQRLAELGTPSARRYLLEWLDRIKLDGSARVKRELFESLKKLESSQGASRLDPVVATKEAAR
jgi:HEAT repeat protein